MDEDVVSMKENVLYLMKQSYQEGWLRGADNNKIPFEDSETLEVFNMLFDKLEKELK